jgi:putative transposase
VARPPRLELPGVPLHIIQRGVNRGACFFGDVDRRFYLKCLRKFSERRGCAVHAYVLMTNHVHVLLTPRERGAAAALLQDLGRTYVRVLNTVHARTGTLWEGRYKSSIVDSESYYFACHRYIELNPVRAGIVAEPIRYAWSSHPHYASGVPDGLITEHPSYKSLAASPAERQACFRTLFRDQLESHVLDEIRAAANCGAALGSASFLNELKLKLGRDVGVPRRGRPPRREPREVAEAIPGKLL